MRTLGASVLDATDTGTYAIEYGCNGWEVGPLCERDPNDPRIIKGPFGKTPHPNLTPRGLHDFTSDIGMIAVWWGSGIPWNIGIRPPASMFVLDFDDLRTLGRWASEFDTLPETLTTVSGREGGGLHLWYQHPGGKLSAKRLRGLGVDLKTHDGYLVAAPSVHPDTGRRYTRVDAPVAAAPSWLTSKLRPEAPSNPQRSPVTVASGGFWSSSSSIADEFGAKTSWASILQPHGWRCLDYDPDADGAVWLHPTATSSCSATISNQCLFVYSTNTPFDVTEAGNPNGYTRFRAYAVLNHRGDLSAAACELRAL